MGRRKYKVERPTEYEHAECNHGDGNMSAKENNAVGKLGLGVEMNHLCAISRSIMYPWFMTDKGPR
jgi:hypothetical protein